jgi:Tol biopolymer transport system component
MKASTRVALALLALAVAAPSAQAAFPGRNGAIGFTRYVAGPDSETPFHEQNRLATKLLGSDDERALIECETSDGVPSGGDCTAGRFQNASYSPDGSMLAFDTGGRLGAIGAGGAGLYLLSAVTEHDVDPAFSPDGKRIAFTGGPNLNGGTDVYVRRADGTGTPRVILQDAEEPAWSSRNEIAFVRNGNVYVSRANGSRRRFVTSGVAPDWSPDGGRLVVIRPSARNVFYFPSGGIYTVGAKGHRLHRVGRLDDASSPIWSPNGRWLAYERFDAGIVAKRLGSRAPAREVAVTQISGESGATIASNPTWRPRPLPPPH